MAATVDDGYQEYIPLFVYFALSAYPHYELLIYLAGALHPEVDACLCSIGAMGRFEVRPLSYRYDTDDPQSFKSLRWVLYDDDFPACENVCIGDVDMLIARQEPSLCAHRVRHSETIGLPYSNRIRPGSTKLVGIAHVVRTHAYFPALLRFMQRYRDAIAAGTLRIHNEEVLYRMMAESVGLPDPDAGLATHHGIHLRAFHTQRSLAQQRARADYLFAETFERHLDAFRAAAHSEACAEIVRRLSRIDSSLARTARYPGGGPAAVRQFGNVLSLCDDLLAERAAR